MLTGETTFHICVKCFLLLPLLFILPYICEHGEISDHYGIVVMDNKHRPRAGQLHTLGGGGAN